jgi:hypothetical protein
MVTARAEYMPRPSACSESRRGRGVVPADSAMKPPSQGVKRWGGYYSRFGLTARPRRPRDATQDSSFSRGGMSPFWVRLVHSVHRVAVASR